MWHLLGLIIIEWLRTEEDYSGDHSHVEHTYVAAALHLPATKLLSRLGISPVGISQQDIDSSVRGRMLMTS